MHQGTITTTLLSVLLIHLCAGQHIPLFPYVDNSRQGRGARRSFVENGSLQSQSRQSRQRMSSHFPVIHNTIDPWWPYSSRQNAIREVERLQRVIAEARKNRPVYNYNGPLENFLPLPIGERFKASPFRDPRANRPQLPVGPLSPEIRYAGDLIRAKAAAGYYGDKPLFDL